jgi:molecular chaperone HtpG
MNTSVEHFEFQTEARQLLELMIHSVYSNKDIYLRELVSNSSDALDKLRVESLRSEKIAMPPEGHIRIEIDRDGRTMTVVDNGIGMSHDELIANIGTIAKSGTKEFLADLQSRGEAVGAADLIGQFGVGFYASFMVADSVTVTTRRAGEDQAWRWESNGDGSYTIEESERLESGTTVTLTLKSADPENGLHDYTSESTVRSIIKRYSDFVTWPIQLRREVPVEAPPAEGEDTPADDTTDGEKKQPGVIDASGHKIVYETINSMKAIWRRSATEVTAEEHDEFYHHISHDWGTPARTIQFRAEGTSEYYALLYIPSHAPADLYLRERGGGLHLYVKRVFIMDDATELLPSWLRFMVGVLDSEDLPLNISREILQENRAVAMIRRRLTSKTIDSLREMLLAERADYIKVWEEFGRVLKEGIYHDSESADALLDVSLFVSTAGPDRTTLAEYIGRMKEGQETIYYITGEDQKVVENSPHLEAFRAKGYEVLIMTDPVDEVWLTTRTEFHGKKFASATRGGVDLGSNQGDEAAAQQRKEQTEEYGPMLEMIRASLADTVKEARLSDRLTTSAVCLVADEHDISPQLEKLMKAMGQTPPPSKRILELNPAHPLVAEMWKMYEGGDEGKSRLADYAELLYGQALLAEGGQLPDPARFSRLVADLMVSAGG